MKRKKFSDLSLKITEAEYRELPYLSYSMLAKYEREGFDGYLHMNDEIKSDSLTFGSAVDCLLTEGEAAFNHKYRKMSLAISGKVKEVLDYLSKKSFVNMNSEYIERMLSEAFDAVDFYKNRKLDTRLKMFVGDDGFMRQEYAEYIANANDRQIILSEQMYDDVIKTANALKYDRFVGKYFADNPYVEKYYQLKFKTELHGITYKCMADLIIVDHENKRIFPIDLKTSSKPEYDFPKSFLQWRYDIQATLYWSIINAICKHSPDYADYKVMDYTFIVCNRHSLSPLAWMYEDTQNLNKVYGKNGEVKLRSPFEIGMELSSLINANASVPDYIHKDKPNSIVEQLKKM